MSALAVLLIAKIGVTLVAVGIPMLVFPKQRIEALSGWSATTGTVYRLYGMAVIALLVGYSGGLYEVLVLDRVPWTVLAMGFVSNAGASAVLVVTGEAAQRKMSTVFFGAIAAGLALALMLPDRSMVALW
ncbi:MAG: hypothetical protein AAGF19_08425 [Pseudomonadota bacterium]